MRITEQFVEKAIRGLINSPKTRQRPDIAGWTPADRAEKSTGRSGVQGHPNAYLATQNASQKTLGDKNKEVGEDKVYLLSFFK